LKPFLLDNFQFIRPDEARIKIILAGAGGAVAMPKMELCSGVSPGIFYLK